MRTVMVVDDSTFIKSEIEEMLSEEGYQVAAHARSGEEAVEMIKTMDPDLITLDIIMPGIDGVETAGRMMKEKPGIKNKIIMLSSLCDSDTMSEIKKIGLHYLVPKPLEKDVLLYTLKKMEKENQQP